MATRHGYTSQSAQGRSKPAMTMPLDLGAVSYLDCLVFVLFLAPQLLWRVGLFGTVECAARAVPFLLSLPLAIARERYTAGGGKFVQRATFFEDLVVRCVRYAFSEMPVRVGMVFLSKEVARPFLRFRMLRRGYWRGGPFRWEECEEDGFKGIWIARDPERKPDLVLYYVHGGGFSMGSAYFYLEFLMTWMSVLVCSGYENPAIFALEYTLVPDASYPTQINEVVAGYKHVLKTAQDPALVCVSGDSAGGILVLSLLLRIRQTEADVERGIEVPAMAVLISPWVTLLSKEQDKPGCDYLSTSQLNRYGTLLAGDRISVTDPLISPGCCEEKQWWRRASPSKGFFITYGEREVLAPDIDALITRLDQAGVGVKYDREPAGIHAWPVASVFLSTGQDERLKGLRTMSSAIRMRMSLVG